MMPTHRKSEVLLNGWDPLAGQLPSEVVSATIKRQIKNILKSYTGWFDPFSELIQNALDALENRRTKGDTFDPTIWVEIDLQENRLSVTDNGVGFGSDQFRSFLAPNVSFKKQTERGNKGVGATYIAYGFNYLQIGTKSPDFKFLGTIKDGREWVEDVAATVQRPKIQPDEKCCHSAFDLIDRGSSFTLKLMGEHIRPKKFNWLVATTAEQWGPILRIQTPLGGIYTTAERPLKVWHLRVVDENGIVTEARQDSCDYLYPHTVLSACENQGNITAYQRELLNKGKDVSKLPDKYFNLNGLYKVWTLTDFVEPDRDFSSKLNDAQAWLAKQYDIYCYGFFGYSTDLWDFYNDNILRIRKNERILKGGLQLATNSMPQGGIIQIPLNRNIGYQNVCHVVLHFKNADPDLGRKGFQPELENLGKAIAIMVVNFFLSWRKHLKKETGAPPDIVSGKKLHDWIAEQERHEKEAPLVITRKDVFLPMMEPALTSTPLNEQDAVSLFNQLLAGGVIRGLSVMSSSSFNQYDAICRLHLKEPIGNQVFDKISNPLGVEQSRANPFVSEPRVLEYKYTLDGLIEEFEKEVKKEKELHVIVAWEMGSRWEQRYEITSLLDFHNLHHRYFHGCTHIARNAMTGDGVFALIILSELIDYINDPDGVQQMQEQKYSLP